MLHLALALSALLSHITQPETDRQAEVRRAVQLGRLVPLTQVVDDALRRYPGTLVEVELEDDKYEIEILGEDGVVMELEYDARNGRFLGMEVEDD